MRASLLIGFALLAFSGCTRFDATVVPKHFNAPEFAGLVGDADSAYPSVHLDFALDTSDGGETLFVSCPQVEATDSDAIRADQHSLFRSLQVNCLALKRYGESHTARVSHLPVSLTREIIGALPVTALPFFSEEEAFMHDGGLLESSAAVDAIESLSDGRVRVLTPSEEIYYAPLAQADFDGDGLQDMLLRLDWRARDAFGKGVDLIQVTRRTPGGELRVTWRMRHQ